MNKQFEQLMLLYNQFLNLSDEIKLMLEGAEYNEMAIKLKYKNSLLKKLSATRKNLVVTEDQKLQLSTIEQNLKEKEEFILNLLENKHFEISEELKKVSKSLKLGKAYNKEEESQGSIVSIYE